MMPQAIIYFLDTQARASSSLAFLKKSSRWSRLRKQLP